MSAIFEFTLPSETLAADELSEITGAKTHDGQRTGLGRLIDRVRGRAVSSLFIVATPAGRPLSRWTLRTRFDSARRAAAEQAGDDALAERIRRFQFRDIRPKAASELPVEHASRLLGHSEKEITERVYRRLGEVVKPTK